MKKLLTILLSVLMVMTVGSVNVFAENLNGNDKEYNGEQQIIYHWNDNSQYNDRYVERYYVDVYYNALDNNTEALVFTGIIDGETNKDLSSKADTLTNTLTSVPQTTHASEALAKVSVFHEDGQWHVKAQETGRYRVQLRYYYYDTKYSGTDNEPYSTDISTKVGATNFTNHKVENYGWDTAKMRDLSNGTTSVSDYSSGAYYYYTENASDVVLMVYHGYDHSPQYTWDTTECGTDGHNNDWGFKGTLYNGFHYDNDLFASDSNRVVVIKAKEITPVVVADKANTFLAGDLRDETEAKQDLVTVTKVGAEVSKVTFNDLTTETIPQGIDAGTYKGKYTVYPTFNYKVTKDGVAKYGYNNGYATFDYEATIVTRKVDVPTITVTDADKDGKTTLSAGGTLTYVYDQVDTIRDKAAVQRTITIPNDDSRDKYYYAYTTDGNDPSYYRTESLVGTYTLTATLTHNSMPEATDTYTPAPHNVEWNLDPVDVNNKVYTLAITTATNTWENVDGDTLEHAYFMYGDQELTSTDEDNPTVVEFDASNLGFNLATHFASLNANNSSKTLYKLNSENNYVALGTGAWTKIGAGTYKAVVTVTDGDNTHNNYGDLTEEVFFVIEEADLVGGNGSFVKLNRDYCEALGYSATAEEWAYVSGFTINETKAETIAHDNGYHFIAKDLVKVDDTWYSGNDGTKIGLIHGNHTIKVVTLFVKNGQYNFDGLVDKLNAANPAQEKELLDSINRNARGEDRNIISEVNTMTLKINCQFNGSSSEASSESTSVAPVTPVVTETPVVTPTLKPVVKTGA